jgi:pimeloyl-ACP methyl ester carboxylesterase
MSGLRVVEAARALLALVGPAVLVTHSMSGPFGWKLADDGAEQVLAIVAVAPGPPANIQPHWSWPAYPEEQPIRFTPDEVRSFTASSRFPDQAFARYYQSLVPESARIYNERLNARGLQLCVERPEVLRAIPTLLISADSDPNHPDGVDARTAAYVGAEHVSLAQAGLAGHGHLMMIEHGNLAVADLILNWLETHLPC